MGVLLNTSPSNILIGIHTDHCLLGARNFLKLCNDKGRVSTFMARQRWIGQEENRSTFLRKRECGVLSGMSHHANPRIVLFRVSNVRMPRFLQAIRVKKHRIVTAHDSVSSDLNNVPLVKVCGVTNVTDALKAVKAGAKYVGMILWPKSKRSISLDAAKAIAHVVRLHQAEPVGVFVDEDAETILKHCHATGICTAQLHGEGARSSLLGLPAYLKTIYVLHVDKNGVIQTPLPMGNQVDWILLDSLQGGSGLPFDWEKYEAPTLNSKHGWLLAGGLSADNVAAAISVLKPDAVDVSSGVTGPDGVLKDHARILRFMDAVKSCGSCT